MASKNKMEKCKDHTQEKQDSGECCQVVEQQKAEQQTYEYKPKQQVVNLLLMTPTNVSGVNNE